MNYFGFFAMLEFRVIKLIVNVISIKHDINKRQN